MQPEDNFTNTNSEKKTMRTYVVLIVGIFLTVITAFFLFFIFSSYTNMYLFHTIVLFYH